MVLRDLADDVALLLPHIPHDTTVALKFGTKVAWFLSPYQHLLEFIGLNAVLLPLLWWQGRRHWRMHTPCRVTAADAEVRPADTSARCAASSTPMLEAMRAAAPASASLPCCGRPLSIVESCAFQTVRLSTRRWLCWACGTAFSLALPAIVCTGDAHVLCSSPLCSVVQRARESQSRTGTVLRGLLCRSWTAVCARSLRPALVTR